MLGQTLGAGGGDDAHDRDFHVYIECPLMLLDAGGIGVLLSANLKLNYNLICR